MDMNNSGISDFLHPPNNDTSELRCSSAFNKLKNIRHRIRCPTNKPKSMLKAIKIKCKICMNAF
jgi:hypothetical protein